MKTQYYVCLSLLCLAQIAQSQTWNALGSGLNGPVYTIQIHEGNVYAGGYFTNAGGNPDADFLARWDGCKWHSVAPGLNGAVDVIALSGEKVYVAGRFTMTGDNGQPFKPHIAMWDGTEWNALGGGLDYYVSDIEIIGEDVYAGGGFNWAGGIPEASLIARWDGKAWHALGTGPYFYAYDFAYVSDMATDGISLYVVGSFENMGGEPKADRVAKWDYINGRSSGTWQALGEGIDPRGLWNDHLKIVMHESTVYVSGSFTDAGGNANADYVVRWDGNAWSGITSEAVDSMTSVQTIFQEEIYCSTRDYGIKRWKFSNETWEAFTWIEELYTLASDADNLYAGGFFKDIDGQPILGIARWGVPEDCTISGITDPVSRLSPQINVYPNPSYDVIHYSIGDAYPSQMHVLTLTDATGRVLHIEETGDHVFDISGLPEGVYFLQVQAEGYIGAAKIVKN